MVDQQDDDEIIDYLEDMDLKPEEIYGDIYRPLTSEGEPDDKPRRERCERYDGPFDEDAPDALRRAVGVLVHTAETFDPASDEDIEAGELGMDAEWRTVEVFGKAEELEAAWNRTRRNYETGENRFF